VKTCQSKPLGADTYFGTLEQFENAQVKRQRVLMLDFLSKLTKAERAKLIKGLQPDMKRLGITS